MKALRMCYKALLDANVSVDFINTEELKDGIAKNYKIIYMPEMNHIPKESAEALTQFVKDGGYLWVDGIFGWKDDYGIIFEPAPGFGLNEVFGAELIEMVGCEKPSDMTFADSQESVPSYEWEVWYHLTTGKAIASFESGNAAIIKNKYGMGQTLLVGTSLCRGLRENYNPEVASFIAQYAVEALQDSIEVDLDVYSGKLLSRCMNGPKGLVVVVSNYRSETGRGKLKVKGNCSKAIELLSNAEYSVQNTDGWCAVSIDVPANETQVYAFV